VGIQVEVVLKWMSDIAFDKSTREWISILIGSSSVAFLGEETDMVALCTNCHSPFKTLDWRAEKGFQLTLHLINLLVKDVSVLAFGNAITEVVDMLGHCDY